MLMPDDIDKMKKYLTIDKVIGEQESQHCYHFCADADPALYLHISITRYRRGFYVTDRTDRFDMNFYT